MFESFGTHTFASSDLATTAGSTTEAGGLFWRPPSPPQAVPGRRQAGGGEIWEDASTRISASPAGSDATEQFLDCYSEVPSTASSMGDDCGSASEELLSRALPRFNNTPDTPTGALGISPGSWQLQQERQRRLAAEATAAELQRQLDEISAALLAFRTDVNNNSNNSSGCTSGGSSLGGKSHHRCHQQQQQPGLDGSSSAAPSVPALLQGLLRQAAEQRQAVLEQSAALQQRIDSAHSLSYVERENAAYVARLVAGMCARAATAADLETQWREERSVLERRLEQAARMGRAMLKHQKEHGADPEPWRQQLLNCAVSVGCSLLGAAAAVLIIRRAQGP